MHGHFCLRIENIFDDDNEVTNFVILEMNQKKNYHVKASYLFNDLSVMQTVLSSVSWLLFCNDNLITSILFNRNEVTPQN